MVHALCLDKDGKLWVGTDEGIDKYTAKLKAFTHVNPANTDGVRSIIVFDHNNNCWFVAGASLSSTTPKQIKKLIIFPGSILRQHHSPK
jgi:ligand-binding sensor domain-containing protein